MITKWATSIANKLAELSGEDVSADQLEIYIYGLECFLNTFITIVLLFVWGVLSHTLGYTLIWVITFSLLRHYTGGAHAPTQLTCIFGSFFLGCLDKWAIIYLTVRRSVRYNGARHKTEIGSTKRKKVRSVDFCDTLADILKKAKKEHRKQIFSYGELYQRNYYREVKEKNRVYTMSFTIWMAQRKFRLITTRLTLYVSDRTEHTKLLQR